MTKNIHHIERIKSTVLFNVSWADQIGLVNIVKIKRISEIWVLDTFGNVGSFFLTKPSRLKTRWIVLSDGKLNPDLVNSHLMADVPI